MQYQYNIKQQHQPHKYKNVNDKCSKNHFTTTTNNNNKNIHNLNSNKKKQIKTYYYYHNYAVNNAKSVFCLYEKIDDA